MSLFSVTLQYAISGITDGSIYAIIGICWSVVYLITKVLNFTTGEFVMLGGMLTWGFRSAGFGLAPSILLAVACTILISMILERYHSSGQVPERDYVHDDDHSRRLGHQGCRASCVGI